MGNAIKFTHSGWIRIHAAYKDNHFISSEVEDTGVGIPQESISHIFESFRQADSSTVRKYGGTGLGLAISSSLVKLMGGSIDVSSELDKGSRFSIHLPLEVVEPGRCDTPCPGGYEVQAMLLAKKKIRVLVVEDNTFNLKNCQSHAQTHGDCP